MEETWKYDVVIVGRNWRPVYGDTSAKRETYFDDLQRNDGNL